MLSVSCSKLVGCSRCAIYTHLNSAQLDKERNTLHSWQIQGLIAKVKAKSARFWGLGCGGLESRSVVIETLLKVLGSAFAKPTALMNPSHVKKSYSQTLTKLVQNCRQAHHVQDQR